MDLFDVKNGFSLFCSLYHVIDKAKREVAWLVVGSFMNEDKIDTILCQSGVEVGRKALIRCGSATRVFTFQVIQWTQRRNYTGSECVN